jgi:hypothetical protein
MKRILFALAMVGCVLSLTPRGQAATEVSINFFYDNLSPYGNWVEVGDYGYCFQPNVAVNNSSWRPYADGYWAYTDVGWTWVSYEDFGWATYHYGRWADLTDLGWVWVPGYEWGPAWVSWRTGGDYIGWAPLPPAGARVYEGRPITGHVDVEFDIGPLYYNFVDIRYIGEPVLRERLIAPQQNVTIINRTVNVTNITYNNSVVYNYGPDINRVNQFSTRPVQHLTLQRETDVAKVQVGRGNLNRVNGNQLVAVAPAVQKSTQQVAPKQVKPKVQQAKIEHGWQGVSNRDQLQAQMKSENPKNVPPPTFQPQKPSNTSGASSTASGNAVQPNESNAGAENAAANSSGRTGRQAQRNNRGQNAEQNPNANENGTGPANRQAQRQQPGQRRARGPQNQPSATQDQDRQNEADNQQAEQTYNRPNRPPRPQQNPYRAQPGQSPEQQNDENAQRQGGERQGNAQPQRGQQNEMNQSKLPHGQRPEATQPQNERADQNRPGGQNDRANQGRSNGQGERAAQHERAQQPPQRERGQEAHPRPQPSQPQGQDQQNSERKGKKKKPNEPEPSP